jgi:hypothetical protein
MPIRRLAHNVRLARFQRSGERRASGPSSDSARRFISFGLSKSIVGCEMDGSGRGGFVKISLSGCCSPLAILSHLR